MENKIVKNDILINAPIGIVWDVLVNPENTKKYMFGCETVSEWQAGSQLNWKMDYEGKEMIAVTGTILEIEPEKKLVYTAIDPSSDIDADSEQLLQVSYTLEPQNEKTVLTVTQGDYAKVSDGEKRFKEAYNNGEGWNPILVQIKAVAEKNAFN